jgi:hypothetical protein
MREMIEIDRSPVGLPESRPERLFVLQLADIAKGRDFAAARHTAWRFYAGTFEGPAVLATVGEPARGAGPVMTSLIHGNHVEKTLQDIRLVERLPQVRAATYELRQLKIPGVVLAFWLKSAAEDGDLIVPHTSLLRGLKRMKPYPAKKFLAILLPYARKRAKANDAPKK